MSLPFNFITLGGLRKILYDLEEQDSEGRLGYVLYSKMWKPFMVNSQWKEALDSDDSVTSKLLKSKDFRFKNGEGEIVEDAVDIEALMYFGLLHCVREKQAAGQVFYQLLQQGGTTCHTWISADDKDSTAAFDRLVYFCTKMIMDAYGKFGGGVNKYTKEELQQVRGAIDELKEQWIDGIFDVDSKLDARDWIEKAASTENKWALEPKELRERVFEKAGLDWRY